MRVLHKIFCGGGTAPSPDPTPTLSPLFQMSGSATGDSFMYFTFKVF